MTKAHVKLFLLWLPWGLLLGVIISHFCYPHPNLNPSITQAQEKP